ncbi:MAG: 2-oxo acid dehydrogenase subunit E2 [Spirochaetales bacterium]|nr:2-oxo acid dehydrogenase subunit E2 [Spirochaetales bacterium]
MKQYRTGIYRKLSIYGFDAINNGHNIYALLEFDITGIRSWLRQKRKEGTGGSLFVFMLKAIALCMKDFPAFNAMINRRRITEFESVDISIPIEMYRNGEYQNKQYLVRDTNGKSMAEIEKEIQESRKQLDDQKGYVFSKPVQKILDLLPGRMVVVLIRIIMKNHRKVMALSGSLFVTSVSMFSTIPGYIIPYSGGPKAVSFAIGSTMKKPVVDKNEIVAKEMINITVVFNHDIVDGAPAARFINRLRDIIEKEYRQIV